jgi:hypothetical protein
MVNVLVTRAESKDIALKFIEKVISFSFEPYPDDKYQISVKDEYKNIFKKQARQHSNQ